MVPTWIRKCKAPYRPRNELIGIHDLPASVHSSAAHRTGCPPATCSVSTSHTLQTLDSRHSPSPSQAEGKESKKDRAVPSPTKQSRPRQTARTSGSSHPHSNCLASHGLDWGSFGSIGLCLLHYIATFQGSHHSPLMSTASAESHTKNCRMQFPRNPETIRDLDQNAIQRKPAM